MAWLVLLAGCGPPWWAWECPVDEPVDRWWGCSEQACPNLEATRDAHANTCTANSGFTCWEWSCDAGTILVQDDGFTTTSKHFDPEGRLVGVQELHDWRQCVSDGDWEFQLDYGVAIACE